MVLLLNADLDGWWPVDAASFPVGPHCFNVMVWPFPLTGGACVVHTGWMESVRRAVAAHTLWFVVLDCHVPFSMSSSAAAAAAATATATAAAATATVGHVLFVGHRSGELGDLVQHDLDLRNHCIRICFRAVLDVGCLFFLGDCCLGYTGNVFAQFVTGIGFGCLVGTVKVVLAGRAAAVLCIDFIVFVKTSEV